jgi:hypothetical protein
MKCERAIVISLANLNSLRGLAAYQKSKKDVKCAKAKGELCCDSSSAKVTDAVKKQLQGLEMSEGLSFKSRMWSSGTIQQALNFNAKVEAVNYLRTYP